MDAEDKPVSGTFLVVASVELTGAAVRIDDSPREECNTRGARMEAATLLLGSGLVGLSDYGRKRRQQTSLPLRREN